MGVMKELFVFALSVSASGEERENFIEVMELRRI